MNKKSLYESIMTDVSKIVKRHLNENNMNISGYSAIIDKIEDCGCLTDAELNKLRKLVRDYEMQLLRRKPLPEV